MNLSERCPKCNEYTLGYVDAIDFSICWDCKVIAKPGYSARHLLQENPLSSDNIKRGIAK